MCSSIDSVYGHKMPDNFMLTQERSQLCAYNKNAANPEGHGFEVFVYNLPRDILIQYIYKFMQQSGKIYDIRVMMDFSGFNRGTCYVKFLTRMAARKAVLVYDYYEILPDHPVHIRLSFDNHKLVMSNVPKWILHYQVSELISTIIGAGLTSVSLDEQEVNESSNSFILTYDNHRKALEARKKLWPGIELWNTSVSVDWAVPQELKESRVLYFNNLPEYSTRSELFAALTTTIDIHTVLRLRLHNGIGCIVFTGYQTRRDGQRILTDTPILGRLLYLSHKRFHTPSPFVNECGAYYDEYTTPNFDTQSYPNAEPDQHPMFGSSAVREPPNIDYQSCSKSTVDQLPLFCLPPVQASPGFYNELQAVQKAIHVFLEKEFPNRYWTCLDPEQHEVCPHIGAIRVRPTVNNQTFEFVLLCVSSEFANNYSASNPPMIYKARL